MSRIRALSILALVFLIAGMYFIKEGNGEYRRPQSNDEIAKLKQAVEKLKSDVRILQMEKETIKGLEKYDKEQIGFLEEYLKAVELIHSQMKTQLEVGIGGRTDEPRARYEVHKARATLALGNGNLILGQKEYQAAINAAEDQAKYWTMIIQSGVGNRLSELVRTRCEVLETKLILSRVKKLIRQKQNH